MAESADFQDLAKPVCRGALPVFVRRPHCCERRAGNVLGAEVLAPPVCMRDLLQRRAANALEIGVRAALEAQTVANGSRSCCARACRSSHSLWQVLHAYRSR